MGAARQLRTITRWGTAGAFLGLSAYAAYAVAAWLRYGHAARADAAADSELDRFMPNYDIVERHHIEVAAPAALTYAAATELDIQRSPIVRAIFRGRELLLGSAPDPVRRPREFLALTKSLGWGVLSEARGREIVMGAVTQPWKADVVFQALSPRRFIDFGEPDYVKIAWTLRADPLGRDRSVFRTETRAIATDAVARTKFRRYWSLMSPGIVLIRRATLRPVRDEAERRARVAAEFATAPVALR